MAQRLLTFDPAVRDQAASVSNENHIQIRDIKKDTVLMEINAHRSKIIWLGYDPTGQLLACKKRSSGTPMLKQYYVK